MRGDMFNKMHGPIVHERLLEMNQMSPHPIHALDAKPKPMIVYGWVERHAQDKAKAAEEAVEADSNANRSKKNLQQIEIRGGMFLYLCDPLKGSLKLRYKDVTNYQCTKD